MDSRRINDDERQQKSELDRYRQAATHALDQLDWCIDYLYRVHKPEIARTIARNRKRILEGLN